MHKQNPFGNADGSRADLKEIEYSFITDSPFGIQITKYQDELLNKRVIVGAKGSGKTVYLRKIQSILKHRYDEIKTGIYVDDIVEQNMNCTESVIAFCDFYEKTTLSEKWTQAWKIAILTSISHKVIYDQKLESYSNLEEKQAIRNFLKSGGLLFDSIFSVYQCMSAILNTFNTENKMNSFLKKTCWTEIYNIIQKVIRTFPPMYIFLDAIDIEYERAPMHWTSCQKGLFYALMAFLQDYIYGEKLHLIMSLRDNVFTALLASENSTKFSRESHIFSLSWDESSIKEFLSRKIDKLSDCYFYLSGVEKTLTSWLGIDTLTNENNEIEKIEQFILRHTRLVPRDIINICNGLAPLNEQRAINPELNASQWIKEIVLKESEKIGEELITICAKNIKINAMPINIAQYECSDIYTSDKYYAKGTSARLLEILSQYKNTPMTFNTIENMNSDANIVFGKDIHLSDILWQNGAVGFVDDNETVHFYAQKFHGATLLPRNKKRYVFRSCVNIKLHS